MMETEVGKFGHHPDQEIDSDLEVERLRGLLHEAHMGLIRALDYRAATPEGLSIKRDVRDALDRTGFVGDLATRSDFYRRMTVEWQPIATAPMNGTRILLCYDCLITTGYFEKGNLMSPWARWISDYPSTGKMPTHWMALPLPPKGN